MKLLVCLLSLLLGISTISADSKENLKNLIEDYWNWRLEEAPLLATQVGVHKYDDKMPQLGVDRLEIRLSKGQEFLDKCKRIDPSTLTGSDKLNYDIFQDMLQRFVQGYSMKEFLYNSVNFLEGAQKGWAWLIPLMPFETEANYRTFLTRMSGMAVFIQQNIDMLSEAIKVHKTSHQVSVEKVPQQIQAILDTPVTSYNLYRPFITLENVTIIADNIKQELRDEAVKIISKEIYGAFRNLSDFLTNEYMKHTRQNYGVGSLDGGLAYYESALQWHLTTDMTPHEVHNLGLAEVKRINQEMDKVMASVGFTGTLQEFMNHLKSNKSFFLETEEDLLNRYMYIIGERVHPELSKVFGKIPDLPLVVRKAEKDTPAGVYMEGTADGKVPGVFLANVEHPETRPTFDMLALCLHEAEPGHHLQISYMLTAKILDHRKHVDYSNYYLVPFHFPFNTAYTEGWGLYAEALGHDMGIYTNPYELFGRYVSEMFRACRLVVDTGIHSKGWTREEAIDYMAKYITDPRHQIEVEIDRYITWPGQACAYKIGELQILRLRKKAEIALQGNFDLKEFHAVVLQEGSLTMSVLEKVVDKYIHQKTSSSNSLKITWVTFFVVIVNFIINDN